MKYIYVNASEDRVVTISKRRESALITDPNLQEYIVQDDFDLGKDMPSEDGTVVRLDGFLTATEFVDRFNNDYVAKRVAEYPYVGDQLDALWKGGDDAEQMRQAIVQIKEKHPKPSEVTS